MTGREGVVIVATESSDATVGAHEHPTAVAAMRSSGITPSGREPHARWEMEQQALASRAASPSR